MSGSKPSPFRAPFLERPEKDWVASNELAFAIADGFPVSPGHTLVITRRVVPTWFDATQEEQAAVMGLANSVRELLMESLTPMPDGFNVGFNAGDAAGQTVPHLHVHVIPRYHGDVADPRGGVRHVIPSKGNYLAGGDPKSGEGSVGGGSSCLELSTGFPGDPVWKRLANRIVGAGSVDILVSFIQLSGLGVIGETLFRAIRSGANIRILFGDYLSITDPQAVWRLLGWMEMVAGDFGEQRLQVRMVRMEALTAGTQSFHPKALKILDDSGVLVVVGSSNLSRPALLSGVEWNLLSSDHRDGALAGRFDAAFDDLWGIADPVTSASAERYERTAEKVRAEMPEPEMIDQPAPLPTPRPWQAMALAELKRIRGEGFGRALISVATGLGKTWLAAFDLLAFGRAMGQRPRVLVVAHRAEILSQAERVFRAALDDRWEGSRVGNYLGAESDLSGDLTIASIQKLSRPDGLTALDTEVFDYAIIDEVHHAEAPSYRKVLARLQASFVLGLTATPERGDGVDVAVLFDDVLAWHATIGDGIEEGSLVPFHYIGLKDDIDFQQIPWRNGRFDPGVLEGRVENSARMERLWKAWQAHRGERTLVFCCSQRHAVFTRNWLRARGVAAAAVFCGNGSDPRGASLDDLEAGKLSALCVVDLFNEGIDLPTVDRVIMLRPTESKVIFIQQLGRGLRAAEGKSRLIVIDFVGNHRVFAQRIIHLLSLTGEDRSWSDLAKWLKGGVPSLPPKCLIDVEIEARDMLSRFVPSGGSAAVEAYRAMRDELGYRPSMVDLYHRGFLPSTFRARHECWFGFVKSETDLGELEEAVYDRFKNWLRMLETTALTKVFKMVVLRTLLEHDGLWKGMMIEDLSERCRQYLLRHRVLHRDLKPNQDIADHGSALAADWAAWWKKWPLDRWLSVQAGRQWFREEDGRFLLAVDCPSDLRCEFESMTVEIVDYRIAHYVRSRSLGAISESGLEFTAKVSHASGRAILFLPDKGKVPQRPTGPVDVRLPDGDVWQFRFVKVACNVAHPKGAKANQLGDLLKTWFGADAGLPGTGYSVKFSQEAGQWDVSPVESGETAAVASDPSPVSSNPGALPFDLIESPSEEEKYRTLVPVYHLTAAAGLWGPETQPNEMGWVVPGEGNRISDGMFVAFVRGHSMEPKIASDSWCLFRPCPLGSRDGRVLLMQFQTDCDAEGGGRFTVKKYHSEKSIGEDSWQHRVIQLLPLNPEYRPIEITEANSDEMFVVGEFVRVL